MPPPCGNIKAPSSPSSPSISTGAPWLPLCLAEREGDSVATRMEEERWPFMWSFFRGWFTPSVLFVVLNIVIGTIAVTSRSLRSHCRHPHDEAGHGVPPENLPPLSRGPSAALERLRSIGLHRFRSGEIPFVDAPPPPSISEANRPPLVRGPSAVVERLRSIGLYRFDSGEIPPDAPHPSSPSQVDLPDAVTGGLPEGGAVHDHEDDHSHKKHHYGRSRSDSGEEATGKLAGRMKKSASASSAFAHLETDEIVRRPATARGGRHADLEEEDGEVVEVDARADDFINRFRRQLQLQRLDSIMKYKEMLNRGK